jgi:DNA-directed RNA polymerase subunit RPC12/RpoP
MESDYFYICLDCGEEYSVGQVDWIKKERDGICPVCDGEDTLEVVKYGKPDETMLKDVDFVCMECDAPMIPHNRNEDVFAFRWYRCHICGVRMRLCKRNPNLY